MLEPEYIAGLSDDFVELYAKVERDITADVARRILKTNYLTPTAKWQLEKANQIGMLNRKTDEIIANATGLSNAEIKKLMSNAGYKALEADDKIYALAGFSKADLEKSDTLRAILLQGTSDTRNVMRNFTKTIAKTSTVALEASLDRAYLQIMSGAFTLDQAVKNAITDLARQGITKIAYPSKTSVSVEAGVRRAVTTGINQTCAKLQLERASELGVNHVETTRHMGARPSHAEWQGKVFSLSGKSKYPNFYKETGYGTGEGLCGWNCRHSFFPYFAGISKPVSSNWPSDKSNEQIYEESQKQRYYERRVRDAKRRVATYEGAADSARSKEEQAEYEAAILEAKKLVRKRQKALREYCKATGRDQDYSRTYVTGYNKPYTIG